MKLITRVLRLGVYWSRESSWRLREIGLLQPSTLRDSRPRGFTRSLSARGALSNDHPSSLPSTLVFLVPVAGNLGWREPMERGLAVLSVA